jgi:hypothetical protein
MEARCIVCGRRPAALIKVERNVGMVLMHTWHSTDGPFCRDHGIASARRYLLLTLLLGWWGVRSFFLNFKAIAMDVRALTMAQRLPAASSMQEGVSLHADRS